MGVVTELLYYGLENISILFILKKVMNKEKGDKALYVVLLFCFQFLLLYLIGNQYISSVTIVFSYMAYVLYIFLQYKVDLTNSVIIFAIMFFINMIIQLLSGLPFLIANGSLNNNDVGHGVILITLLLSILCYLFIPINKIYDFINNKSLIYKFISVVCLLVFIYLLVFWKLWGYIEIKDYIMSITFILILSIVIFEWQKQLYKTKEKTRELELSKLYENTFEELIKDISAKQHSFKNQLNAILSQHITIKTYEELVIKQKGFINEIDLGDKDIGLLKLSDKILASFIYAKITHIRSKGINIEYEIKNIIISTKASKSELIECVGILIDNAVEECSNGFNDIKIELGMINERFYFSIMNKHTEINQDNISLFFTKGYSTKSDIESRGFGLYNLKKIVEKYNGEISVENIMISKKNYIRFHFAL